MRQHNKIFFSSNVVAQNVAQRLMMSAKPLAHWVCGGWVNLKIRRFVNSGRAGSIPARGTIE